MGTLSVTSLRERLYKVVDKVIETGIPQEIERRGYRLKIVLEKKKGKLDNLKPHDTIVGDPDDLDKVKAWEWDEGK